MWRCDAWDKPMCSVWDFEETPFVRDGCTACIADCYRDSSVMLHFAVSVGDAIDRLSEGRVLADCPSSRGQTGGSVWQFDSVGVFLIALVLFGKNFFEPLCLLFCNPFIHRRRMMAYEELLAATVTPKDAHFLEISSFLSALSLLYRHRPHLLNFSN
jgi:hypothetical protein